MVIKKKRLGIIKVLPIIAFFSICLSACGVKGGLYLPDEQGAKKKQRQAEGAKKKQPRASSKVIKK